MGKLVSVCCWIVFIFTEHPPLCSGLQYAWFTGEAIAAQAQKMIGSTKYQLSDDMWDYVTGTRYRGHVFVADVLKSMGVIIPRKEFPAVPIDAEEWGNPSSQRMKVLRMCWKICPGPARLGDVVAFDGLVGIVTKSNTIAYSNPFAKPPGLIVEGRSKYVPDVNGACWRYDC